MMKLVRHIRQGLTRGQILPPPFSYNLNNNNSRKANKAATPFTLLHLANASCGRVFCVCMLLCLLMPFALCSCDKQATDALTPMHQMYNESINLPQATLDSITTFTHKFGGYVGSHPESRQDQFFDPTLQNLRDAAALYGYSVKDATLNTSITVNDEWAGETFIFF